MRRLDAALRNVKSGDKSPHSKEFFEMFLGMCHMDVKTPPFTQVHKIEPPESLTKNLKNKDVAD